jgi:hypothetical protein
MQERIRRRDVNDAFQRIQIARRRAVHRAGARLGIKPFNPDGSWRWLTPAEVRKLDEHVIAVEAAMRIILGHRETAESTQPVQTDNLTAGRSRGKMEIVGL